MTPVPPVSEPAQTQPETEPAQTQPEDGAETAETTRAETEPAEPSTGAAEATARAEPTGDGGDGGMAISMDTGVAFTVPDGWTAPVTGLIRGPEVAQDNHADTRLIPDSRIISLPGEHGHFPCSAPPLFP